MNREIKFRAWDGEIMHEGVGVFEDRAFDFDGEASWLWHEPAEAIMQHIGRKDESGKEICEGDIINGTLDNPSVPTMGVIEYSSYWSAFGCENEAGFTMLFKIRNIKIIIKLFLNKKAILIRT